MSQSPTRTNNNKRVIFLAILVTMIVISFLENTVDDDIAANASNSKDNVEEETSISSSSDDDDDDSCSNVHDLMSGANSILEFWTTSLQTEKIQNAIVAGAKDNVNGRMNVTLQDLTSSVLEKISPRRLYRSVQHSASNSHSQETKIAALLKKLQLRRQQMHGTGNDGTNNHDHEKNKVRILVFGGSPTAGSNCYRNNGMKKQATCAWPGHLEGFLNSLIGFEGFEVVNYAIGASDSSIATAMMKHKLVPDSMLQHGVDIIVYAYTVNDSSRYFQEHSDIYLRLHDFLSAAIALTPCDGSTGPMVIYLDDIVHNWISPKSVQIISEYHSKFNTFAFWHEVLPIS